MFPTIFDRYLGRQVGAATFMGVVLLSGVMVLGNVYKKLGELLGNTELPLSVMVEFVSLVVPFSLIFTIPWAFLTGILLVFGRLSADNELIALRMTGMSMIRICLSVFVLAVVLSGVCYWVNVSLAPSAKNRIKRMFYEVALKDPASLFQEGRVLDKVPGYRVFTGSREGNELKDLHIVEFKDGAAETWISAKEATLVPQEGELDFVLQLRGAKIERVIYGPDAKPNQVDPVISETMPLVFPLSRLAADTVRVNASMKSTPTLWEEVQSWKDSVTGADLTPETRSLSLTELSKRYSFSLACFTFALVGIPLGVTAQRRETSSGFALSLITATVYIGIIIFADGLNDKPEQYPHLVMWVPNALFLGIGAWLFARLNRK